MSEQPNRIFMLPREIRDDIYHNVFLTDCCTYQGLPPDVLEAPDFHLSPPTTGSEVRNWHVFDPHLYRSLRYSLLYPTTREHLKGYRDDKSQDATWLLTCKAMLHEGLAQYVRNAVWVWSCVSSIASPVKGNWTPLLNTSCITRFELLVSNLAHYETPYRPQGVDSREGLSKIAERMRAAHLEVEKIRFVGYSYGLEPQPKSPNCGNQVGNMMRNLVTVFAGIHIKKWEIGIYHDMPRDEDTFYWVLFEWARKPQMDEALGDLRILADDRISKPRKSNVRRRRRRHELENGAMTVAGEVEC